MLLYVRSVLMVKLTTDAVSLTLTDMESRVLVSALRNYEPHPQIRAPANIERHKNCADFIRLVLTREETDFVEDV
jgi:hypothetical protein